MKSSQCFVLKIRGLTLSLMHFFAPKYIPLKGEFNRQQRQAAVLGLLKCAKNCFTKNYNTYVIPQKETTKRL